MDKLKILESPEFGNIRTAAIDGEPWLVGNDVAKALGYVNPGQAVRLYVRSEEKMVRRFECPRPVRNRTVINLSGLYSLALFSELPAAEKFCRTITSKAAALFRLENLW